MKRYNYTYGYSGENGHNGGYNFTDLVKDVRAGAEKAGVKCFRVFKDYSCYVGHSTLRIMTGTKAEMVKVLRVWCKIHCSSLESSLAWINKI